MLLIEDYDFKIKMLMQDASFREAGPVLTEFWGNLQGGLAWHFGTFFVAGMGYLGKTRAYQTLI